jgi:hypothetical protein
MPKDYCTDPIADTVATLSINDRHPERSEGSLYLSLLLHIVVPVICCHPGRKANPVNPKPPQNPRQQPLFACPIDRTQPGAIKEEANRRRRAERQRAQVTHLESVVCKQPI